MSLRKSRSLKIQIAGHLSPGSCRGAHIGSRHFCCRFKPGATSADFHTAGKMIPQVLHPTMEHRFISTPAPRIFALRSQFRARGNADLRAEIFATTPCSISLSSLRARFRNAVGRLDERKKFKVAPKNRTRISELVGPGSIESPAIASPTMLSLTRARMPRQMRRANKETKVF
jgi:hypothetical protein